MKYLTAAVIVILGAFSEAQNATETPVDNPCAFCKDGLTADGTQDVPGAPDGGTYTCDDLVGLAAGSDQESQVCSDILEAEVICCPTPVDSPCPWCTNGLSVDSSFSIPMAPNGETCGDLETYAPNTEAESDDCNLMLMAEMACCPSEGATLEPADSPCPWCVNGIEIDGATPIPGAPNGEKCEDLVNFKTLVEADSDECNLMLAAEMICCPNGEPADPSDETAEKPSDADPSDETAEKPSDADTSDETAEKPSDEEETEPTDEKVGSEEPPEETGDENSAGFAFPVSRLGGGLALLVHAAVYLL